MNVGDIREERSSAVVAPLAEWRTSTAPAGTGNARATPKPGPEHTIRALLAEAVGHHTRAGYGQAYQLLIEVRSNLDQGVAAFDGDADTAARYLARTLLDLGRPADAYLLIAAHVADLESVFLLQDKETFLAVLTLADTRRALGHLDAAEVEYRRVADLRPMTGDTTGRAARGVLLAKAGRPSWQLTAETCTPPPPVSPACSPDSRPGTDTARTTPCGWR